jgi:hypothetical protein
MRYMSIAKKWCLSTVPRCQPPSVGVPPGHVQVRRPKSWPKYILDIGGQDAGPIPTRRATTDAEAWEEASGKTATGGTRLYRVTYEEIRRPT